MCPIIMLYLPQGMTGSSGTAGDIVVKFVQGWFADAMVVVRVFELLVIIGW